MPAPKGAPFELERAVQWPQEIAKISKRRRTEARSIHPTRGRMKTLKFLFLCVLCVVSRLNSSCLVQRRAAQSAGCGSSRDAPKLANHKTRLRLQQSSQHLRRNQEQSDHFEPLNRIVFPEVGAYMLQSTHA